MGQCSRCIGAGECDAARESESTKHTWVGFGFFIFENKNTGNETGQMIDVYYLIKSNGNDRRCTNGIVRFRMWHGLNDKRVKRSTMTWEVDARSKCWPLYQSTILFAFHWMHLGYFVLISTHLYVIELRSPPSQHIHCCDWSERNGFSSTI